MANTTSRAPGPRTVRAARTVLVLGAAELLGKVATLVLVVAAARVLGVANYGVFAYGLGLGQLVATVATAGFTVTLIQAGSANPGHLPAILARVLAIRAIVTVPVFAVCALAVVLSRPDPIERLTIIVLVAACFADVWTEALRAACTARERQVPPAVVLLIQRTIASGLVVTLLAIGAGLLAAAVGYLAASVTANMTMGWLIKRIGVAPDFGGVTLSSLVELTRNAWAAGVHTLVSTALFRIDIVILAALAGNEAVGVYAAVYRLLETVLFLGWSVNRVVFPIMASSHEDWRVRVANRRGAGVLSFFLVPYAVLLLTRGEDVLLLLYGPDYARPGTPMLAWLSVAPLLAALGYLASNSLFVRGRDLRPVAASAVGLVVNLLLNFALIPRFEGTGAAVATTASYLVQAALAYMFLWRWVGPVLSLSSIGMPLAASVVFAAELALPGHVLIAALLAGSAYLASRYILARRFDTEQVSVLRQLLPARR